MCDIHPDDPVSKFQIHPRGGQCGPNSSSRRTGPVHQGIVDVSGFCARFQNHIALLDCPGLLSLLTFNLFLNSNSVFSESLVLSFNLTNFWVPFGTSPWPSPLQTQFLPSGSSQSNEGCEVLSTLGLQVLWEHPVSPVPGTNRNCLIVELMNETSMWIRRQRWALRKTQNWKKRFIMIRRIREGSTEVVMYEGWRWLLHAGKNYRALGVWMTAKL